VSEPTVLAPALAAGVEGAKGKNGSRAWSWAALMHRAFAIDVLACPRCGGRLRLIATLHDPAVIRKVLAHLALSRSGFCVTSIFEACQGFTSIKQGGHCG
jgi:hypothetical protein